MGSNLFLEPLDPRRAKITMSHKAYDRLQAELAALRDVASAAEVLVALGYTQARLAQLQSKLAALYGDDGQPLDAVEAIRALVNMTKPDHFD